MKTGQSQEMNEIITCGKAVICNTTRVVGQSKWLCSCVRVMCKHLRTSTGIVGRNGIRQSSLLRPIIDGKRRRWFSRWHTV